MDEALVALRLTDRRDELSARRMRNSPSISSLRRLIEATDRVTVQNS
jgi:hypothetical protein